MGDAPTMTKKQQKKGGRGEKCAETKTKKANGNFSDVAVDEDRGKGHMHPLGKAKEELR